MVEKTVLVKPDKNFKGPLGFQCDPNETYIIVGTKQSLWLDLAEWLMRSGGRKLIIASLKQNLTTNISRKFNSFMTQHRVTVVMTTINRLDTHKDAEDFIREAVKMGPVGGVFCTYMEEKSAHVTHLDAATRLLVPQLKHFVCLLGGSASVCEARSQLGLSACLVQSESPLQRPQALVTYLASVLATQGVEGHTFLVSDHVLTARQKGMAVSLPDVRAYLPSSIPELEVLGQRVSEETHFDEFVTRSPPHRFVRHQLLPVFLVPSWSSQRLEPLMKQLMHPAYCPRTPPCQPSVQESAQHLLQSVLKVQSVGPYNLVAETWSGPLALQLACLLEARGQEVELFLLDAAPSEALARVKALCSPGGQFSGAKLLAALLNLQSNVSRQVSEQSKWEDQLAFVLKHVQLGSTDVQGLSDPQGARLAAMGSALTSLRNHLSALLQSRPPDLLFKGNVHILLTKGAVEADSSEEKYWKKAPNIHVMEDETVDEMLENPMTAAIINEDLAFSWNL